MSNFCEVQRFSVGTCYEFIPFVSHSSFHLKDFVPPFHISFIHCVLCGFDCDECWVVKEKKQLEMSLAQFQERQ